MELTARNEAVLSMSFKAAFLLCADAELAEAVVIEGLENDDSDEISLERLVTCAVLDGSLARFPAVRKACQRFRFLAPQLRSVLNLQDDLRRCFVLRTLVGLSAQKCAVLLNLSPESVNERAGTAAKELAQIPGQGYVPAKEAAALDN